MAREGHGSIAIRKASPRFIMATTAPRSESAEAMHFGYMSSARFDQRPTNAERLPDGSATIEALRALGEAMGEAAAAEPPAGQDRAVAGDGTIPAGYTYFGQFVDHDITKVSGDAGKLPSIELPSFPPLNSLAGIDNARTPFLELDSVYGRPGSPDNLVPPGNGAHMSVGPVSKVEDPRFKKIPGKSLLNDLPRFGPSEDEDKDRAAKIGDPRNDENLIVAQLHVAFLKAHNTLADLTGSFDAARQMLTKMYQSVVLDDFLHRICDPGILDDIEAVGPRFFLPTGPLFMPIEFAAAGFRFGHSMVRSKYDFNDNFPDESSEFFFVFTALSGQIGGPISDRPPIPASPTFPDNWIIQWERFLPVNGSTPQRARPIDPALTRILFGLRNVFGDPEPDKTNPPRNIAPHLARRNLLRGYLFALPTGQALANKFGAAPIEISATTTGLPADVVAPFSQSAPLWLYVLTEAKLNNGRLGAVGTRIVAETLHTLVRRSTPSIFNNDGSRNISARYKLADIINLAAIQDTEIAGT